MVVEDMLSKLKGHTENLTEIMIALDVAKNGNIQIAQGFTKYVIIDKNDDFVIKIPKKENVYYNYCEREAKIYQKAVKWGIAFLFAPTEHAGEIEKGVPYYIQPKVAEFGYEIKGNTSTSHPVLRKKVRQIIEKSGYYQCDVNWFSYVLKSYGEHALVLLLEFLKTYKINDLRDENVGFKNGRPILVDYSGFHGGWNSDREMNRRRREIARQRERQALLNGIKL